MSFLLALGFSDCSSSLACLLAASFAGFVLGGAGNQIEILWSESGTRKGGGGGGLTQYSGRYPQYVTPFLLRRP